MNKEKFLELVSEAIDKQASIDIHFSQYHKEKNYQPVTKDEAFSLAMSFKEALIASDVYQEFGGAGTKHFMVKSSDIGICISYLPDESEINETKQQRIASLKKELAVLENNEEALA